jgi:hypothetical protein
LAIPLLAVVPFVDFFVGNKKKKKKEKKGKKTLSFRN